MTVRDLGGPLGGLVIDERVGLGLRSTNGGRTRAADAPGLDMAKPAPRMIERLAIGKMGNG